ncbi:MAG: TonB-dependent receptor [Opitutales bacterium]|nr:TonB-dependent receptor [Opitutales bacterium]
MMKKNYSSFRGGLKAYACTSIALLSASLLYSQDTADSSQVFELSPFAVEGADDVGYRASSTLAGTRISTNLRDVASSISIVTEQFLEDTGSVTIADVLLYTANTEASGIRGNFSGAQDTGSGNPILERDRDDQQGGFTRVRGLVRADLTRDYFLTDVPLHSFNTTRVTVQRGANAALFGLGSPGGVVNQTTAQADLSRNFGRVRFETDEFGTARASFRANVLLNDNWAIFAAGVKDQTKYMQKQAFSNDERVYVATTWRPREDITIRSSLEFGERHSSRPDIMPPNDGITPWLQMGAPTFDSPVEAAQFFRGSGDIMPGIANSQFFGPHTSSGATAFYFDTNQAAPSQGGTQFIRPGRGVDNNFAFDELMMIYPRIGVDIIRRTGFQPDGTAVAPGSGGFFSGGNQGFQIIDRSIFDYRKNQFGGGHSQQWSDWRMFNLSAEKTWLDDTFGVEVAYFKQDFYEAANNSLQGSIERAIVVDPNRYLIAQDGSGDWIPNPNFGGLAIMGLSGGNIRVKDMDEVRVTGFVDFEFSDLIGENILSRVLGRLRVSSVGQERKRYMETYFARDKVNLVPLENAVAGGAGLSNVDYRYYEYFALDSNINNFLSITNPSQLAGANIQPVPFGRERQAPATTTYTLWNEVSEQFVQHTTAANSLHTAGGPTPAAFFARKSTQTTKSEAVVGQQYLLDNLIVLTGSWRRDRVYGSPLINAAPIGRDARDVTDPAFLLGPMGENKSTDQQNRTWGWVAYAPSIITDRLPWGTNISIHKSKADNFGGGLGRRDSLNRPIPAVTGATEEKGFTISTLDDKLIVKLNWYETGILNQSFQNPAIAAPQGILTNLGLQLSNPANIAQGFTAADVQAVLPPQGVIDLQGVQFDFVNPQNTTAVPNPSRTGTQDFVSEGFELELNYNPVPNWNIIFSFSDQKTTTDNTYPVIGPLYENVLKPLWVDSNFAANYFIDDNATETLRDLTIRAMEIPISVAKAQDGLVTSEQRRYRFSLSSSYRFLQDSPIPAFLGTFTVGGTLRWQDKVGAGFELQTRPDGSLGQDPNAVLYGPSQTFVDVFARSEYNLNSGNVLALQVNIRDLTDNSGLVPLFINPDGSTIWRMQEGRVITGSITYSW